jgi:TonB family protein
MNPVMGNVVWPLVATACFYALALLIARFVPLPTGRLRLTFWYFTLAGFFAIPRLPAVPRVNGFVFTVAAARVARATIPYGRICIYILTAGTILRLIYLALGAWRLRSMVRNGVEWKPDEPCAARIIITQEISTPASYGLLRPAILVPANWPDCDPEARRAALAHELIHIKRLDWLAQIAEEILIAAFWFNPAIHAVVRRIRLAREQFVDAAAIDSTSQPEQYLKALIAFATVEKRFVPVTSFTAAEQLKQRIQAIQKESNMQNRNTTRNLFPALALLASAAVLTTWSLPLRSAVVAQKDADLGNVYKLGAGVKGPELIHKVEPPYAPASKQARIQGTTVLGVVIDKEGVPHTVQVKKSLAADLDQNAIDAVKQWRFHPAWLNGQPVAVEATVEVNFRLLDDDKK